MRIIIIFFLIIKLFAIQYTKKEQQYLKTHPVIYFSAMDYWPINQKGDSIHTNYIKLLNKYGGINIQPIFYHYWSEGFNAAKEGKTQGIMALSFSKKRTKFFFYTPPYNYTPYYLITLKNSPIKTFKDLKGKKVYIAKESIIREILKHPDFKIIWSKTPYKDLVKGKIDAILTFYMPQNQYIKYLKTTKAFINKAGEEHIGINKHYPILYHIILKIMKTIPYSEIEKIKSEYYYNPIPPVIISTPKVTLKELISPWDILIITISAFIIFILLYFYFTRKHLNLSLKKFFISIIFIEGFILSSIIYEIFMFNYYSNQILELKSRSFNELFLTDQLSQKIINLQQEFIRKYEGKNSKYSKFFKNGKIKAGDLLIESKPLKYFLNPQIIHPGVLAKISEIKFDIQRLLNIQKAVLAKKADISLEKQMFNYVMRKFVILRNYIYNENKKEATFIKDKIKYQFNLMIALALIFIFANILLFLLVRNKIYKPIEYLTNTIKNFKQGKFVEKKFFYHDEVGVLIDEFFSFQQQLSNIIQELKKHQIELEKKVQEEVQKRIFQEEILLKQSRLAMMGEIIEAIGHQWKQPLSSINLFIDFLKHNKIDTQTCAENIKKQIEFMKKTLDEFKTFFDTTKEKKEFCMDKIIEKALILIKDDLINNKIKIEKDIRKNFCIKGIENEFEHMILSIIANAKEIFEERNIQKKVIKISTKEDKNFYYLEIEDNAGGINPDIIDKIFDLNFTTKKDGNGIGLYLARLIAIKHTGMLEAENTKNGAKFIFKIRKV
ncbi:ATP-binding protein [Caminibacter sp.]